MNPPPSFTVHHWVNNLFEFLMFLLMDLLLKSSTHNSPFIIQIPYYSIILSTYLHKIKLLKN